MQINKVQTQISDNNSNMAFNAKLKLNDATYYRRFKKMLKYESKNQEEFDSLFERFSNNNIGEIVTMDIVTKNGLENIKINRIGSSVECYHPISNGKKYLFPITGILRETMENPNFSVMWKV